MSGTAARAHTLWSPVHAVLTGEEGVGRAGRVLAPDGVSAEPGLYACGWVKRGPTGIIGVHAADPRTPFPHRPLRTTGRWEDWTEEASALQQ